MHYLQLIAKSTLLYVVSFLFTYSLSQGQMRVGLPTAPPDGSATLDISSGPYSTGNQYRGMAPPKVALVQPNQSAPISKPTVGLLVYNTATTNELSPGYYYWGGSQWLRFATANPGSARVAAVSGQSIPAYLVNQVATLSTPEIIYIADEGREGLFRYQSNSAATVDGAIVLQASNGRYKRIITDGVDVRWFGAKGDGNTDDTQALQKAIDFSASSTEKNSTVFIPTSFVCPVYTLVVKPTVTLALKSNSIVRGKPLSGSESIDTPIIQLNDGANLIGLGTVDGNKDSRFIVADASKPDQKTWSTGVRVLNTSKASLIRDITVMNCGDGVWFQNTPSLRIQNCIFKANGNRVIQGVITDNAIITGNFIDGGAHGIQWFGDPGKSDYCEHWTVSNNIVKNVAGGGIWGSYGRLITITGNNVENCGDVGIDPEYSQDVTVSANTVKNCTNGALTTFNVCQRIMFADNVVWQQANYGPGIKLYGINVNGLTGKTAHVNILGGSILMDNNRNAIETDQDVAEHVLVEAITVICNGSGQAIRSLDCNNTAIVRNKLLAKSSNIVSLEGGSRGRIENNTIEYTGSSPAGVKGVYLYWRSSAYPAKQNNVVSNRLVNCGAGIMDDAWGDNASYSRIEDNETTTVSYQGTLGASYTGFVRGNHNDNNSLVDGSNRYSIKPFITPNSGDVLRFDGANWTNSTSASSSEVSVNIITGGDGGSFPFLTLPASGPNTYDNSVVDITLGGWYGNGKKRIRLTAGQRDGLSVAYTVLGSTSAMGSIKAYTNNGVTTFYAMVGQFGQINIHYVNLHGATGVQNLQNTTPVGNLAFNSDDTPPYLEVTATSMKNSGVNIYTETNLKTGTSTLASNGSATYSIPHALGATPVWWNVQPATATASAASFYVTADATNIVVHYSTPPANTGNLSFTWAVKR